MGPLKGCFGCQKPWGEQDYVVTIWPLGEPAWVPVRVLVWSHGKNEDMETRGAGPLESHSKVRPGLPGAPQPPSQG